MIANKPSLINEQTNIIQSLYVCGIKVHQLIRIKYRESADIGESTVKSEGLHFSTINMLRSVLCHRA